MASTVLRPTLPPLAINVPATGLNKQEFPDLETLVVEKTIVASSTCGGNLSPNLQPSTPPPVWPAKGAPPSPAAIVGNKYLLVGQRESSSSLCRCVDIRTGEELACKIVSRDASGAALVEAHSRLSGAEGVNPLLEVLQGDRCCYLVFPRSYGDLHSHVRARRRLKEPEARSLFRMAARSVEACHRRGLVLRDLKLSKFVFADKDRTSVKLETLEDAVVLRTTGSDVIRDKHGCPAYVSPEILRSNANYSGRAADMWGLGVMLYTMLVGRYPFSDTEHAALFAKIRRGVFALPDCLSPQARCLVRCLLRRDPTHRLTADDVIHQSMALWTKAFVPRGQVGPPGSGRDRGVCT